MNDASDPKLGVQGEPRRKWFRPEIEIFEAECAEEGLSSASEDGSTGYS